MIAQSTIERIKDYAVYDILQHYVPDLKKAGANYRACSPFSGEKTPSFYVVPSKNIFKCFSSGKGGTAIRFVMERFNLSFPEAIKDIADKIGERVEFDEVSTEEQKTEAQHRELLYKINEAAAIKYQEQLKMLINTSDEEPVAVCANPAFDDLIQKRKYTSETIIQWQIGYAPGNTDGYAPTQWRFLTELVGDKNYAAALELGLIHSKKGHTYDAFRHRIMYPIHNENGRITGFGGRYLGSDKANAKYINSPESKAYKKKVTLFGLHFAAQAIKNCKYAFLMEGYTDVISFHQAGYNCAVGTCGTALTEEQGKLLRRYTGKVVLFGDGDEAGQAAMVRAIDILLPFGFEVSVVPMPQFEDGRKVDPDDLTRMFGSAEVVEVEPKKSVSTKSKAKTKK